MTTVVFDFRCPVCSELLSGSDQLAGAQAGCPKCEARLVVPTPLPVQERAAPWKQGEQVADEAPVEFQRVAAGDEAELDMNPMVDVTFLLLIFFMVTSAFSLQKSFEMPAPEQEQASERPIAELEKDPEYVIVRVDQFNTFHVSAAVWDEEQEAPSEQDLLVRLREARRGIGARGGASRMLVMASGESRHERVVTAMDAGTEVGMEDVKLVTVEDDI